MLRPRLIVVVASLATVATATPLPAQRLEVGARIGYSPPTGTQFQLNASARSWEGSALSIGAEVSYWPLAHFGIQGTVDRRFTRAYETYASFPPLGPPVAQVTFDTATTQLAASLRLAARQTVARDLVLTASLGPAMLRLGDAEYSAQYGTLPPYLLGRTAWGVVAGLAATCLYSSRLSVTVSTEYAAYQLQQTGAPIDLNEPALGQDDPSVSAPPWHELTFSAAVSVRIG